MLFKTKDKKLVGVSRKAIVEFGEGVTINEIKVGSPGEYEVGSILIAVPVENVYSLHTESDLHIVYWYAQNSQLGTNSEELGSIDVLVLAISKDVKDAAGVAAVLNDLEPTNIILANPHLKDEIQKAEQIHVETADTWKATPTVGDNNRKLILLPCSIE